MKLYTFFSLVFLHNLSLAANSYSIQHLVQQHLVDVKTINSEVIVELRYATSWNFIGRPLKGYNANKCYLTKEAAQALSAVQSYVVEKGYHLLVFDCYRPQSAVDDMLLWINDVSDQKMKKIFYPNEEKSQLIKNQYIASRSTHSRGGTVDLTLVKSPKLRALMRDPLSFIKKVKDCRKSKNVKLVGQLDMGTTYDCFDNLSNTMSKSISDENIKNRLMLKKAMEKHGFVNYEKEWWHYRYEDESNKDEYFNFSIE